MTRKIGFAVLFLLSFLALGGSVDAQPVICPAGVTGGSCTAPVAFSAEVASGPTYCADAGASDAYACNLSPAPASYAAIIGVPLTFKANTVNTGAATISFNSLGAQAIVKVGATTTTALVTNDIRAGSLVTVQWDGANFECISCDGNYANLAIANTWTAAQTFNSTVTIGAASFTSSGANLGGMTNVNSSAYSSTLSTGGSGYGFKDTGSFRLNGNSSLTPDAAMLGLNATANSLHIVEDADFTAAYDFNNGRCGTSACANPSVIVHSNTQAKNEYLHLSHDTTLAHLDAQSGANGVGQTAFGGAKTLTESSATVVVDIPVASGAFTGATVRWTVVASDGTDHQSRRGESYVAVVNKAGTETCTVGDVGTPVVAVSTGTLTVTTGQDTTGTNVCTFTINAVSSLTQTTLRAYYSVQVDGPGIPAAR